MNNWKKDLIVSHIFVLVMAAQFFKAVEVDTIARDMKMPPVKCVEL